MRPFGGATGASGRGAGSGPVDAAIGPSGLGGKEGGAATGVHASPPELDALAPRALRNASAIFCIIRSSF